MTDLMDLQAQAVEALRAAERTAAVLSAIGELAADVDALGGACDVIKSDNGNYVVRVDCGCFSTAPAAESKDVPVVSESMAVDRGGPEEITAPTPEIAEPPAEHGLEAAADLGPDGILAPTPDAAPEADPEVADDAVQPEYVSGFYTPEDLEKMRRMMAAGNTYKEIAAALKRKPNAVSVKMAGMRKNKASGKRDISPKRRGSFKRALVPGKDRAAKAVALTEPVAAGVPDAATVTPPDKDILRSGVAGDRPYAERAIIAHLNSVGYGGDWSAQADFDLVEGLCKGESVSVVADSLGVESGAAAKRWRSLNASIGDAEHQARLVTILRERANG